MENISRTLQKSDRYYVYHHDGGNEIYYLNQKNDWDKNFDNSILLSDFVEITSIAEKYENEFNYVCVGKVNIIDDPYFDTYFSKRKSYGA